MANITGVFRTVNIGKITSRQGKNGEKIPVVYFTVADNRNYKVDGERPTDFHFCKATGGVADVIIKYCNEKRQDDPTKIVSRQLYITGRLENYENDLPVTVDLVPDTMQLKSVSGKLNGKGVTLNKKISLKDLISQGILIPNGGKLIPLTNVNLEFDSLHVNVPNIKNSVIVVDTITFIDTGKNSNTHSVNATIDRSNNSNDQKQTNTTLDFVPVDNVDTGNYNFKEDTSTPEDIIPVENGMFGKSIEDIKLNFKEDTFTTNERFGDFKTNKTNETDKGDMPF